MDRETFKQEEVKTEEENLPKEKLRIRLSKKWKERSAASKAGTITAIVLFLVCLVGAILFIFARQIFGDETGDAIYGQGVSNGFVAFWNSIVDKKSAIFGTLISIFVAMIIKLIIDLIVNLLSHRSKRGRTVGSLIKSLFKYLIVIITIGVILSLWGVNVTGIVAGIGILTLIIGLGCQSLVNDIVSGIFIVTDSYFEVGDTVIIDGFRGTIVSVGLRTTKIRDWCNNIKSITNSSIQSVVNVSRYSSNATVNIVIPFNQDLKYVEGIIGENIAKIEKNIPNLTGKIIYKGITEINDRGANMYFAVSCSEDNRFQIERDLLRELYILFSENNIGPAYREISMSKASEVKPQKASEKEIKKGAELYSRTHESTSNRKTSKKIMKKTVESLADGNYRDDEDE